jgi:hypothetical protein
MEQEIIPIKLKYTNCYLIRGSGGYIMVDAGTLSWEILP